MILRKVFNRIIYLYNSFFKPPSTDVAFIRRERLAIAYAMSTFTLFVYSVYTSLATVADPANAEKYKFKPPPDTKFYTVEIDTKEFTIKKTLHTPEELKDKNTSHDIK